MSIDLTDIPVVIMAGGRGARFDHESAVRPKPMIEVAGKPILQHIIDGLVIQGFREFIIATGYLHEQIQDHCVMLGSPNEWNKDERWVNTYVGFGDTRDVGPPAPDRMLIRCVHTGDDSHTGERLYRLRKLIGGRRFVLTYGDGLSDVDMAAVLEQHIRTEATVTLTAVRPPNRFGVVEFVDHGPDSLVVFSEKPTDGWINGGFMACEPSFLDYLGPTRGDPNVFVELERTSLIVLGVLDELHAYRHEGYWQCMDTRRDLEQIEADVRSHSGQLPWLRGGKVPAY